MNSGFLQRGWIRVLLAVVFGVAATAQAAVAVLASDPPAVTALRAAASVAAGAAAWGIWRETAWAAVATVAYGLLTSTLLFTLGPLLALDVGARSGLHAGAVSVLLFSFASAWYIKRYTRSSPTHRDRASSER
jgi:hypothetical protein